jgi:hypothetical protein
MVVKTSHKWIDKCCNFFGHSLRIICYYVLGINWLQIIKIMTRREEILKNAIERGCIEGTAEYYGFLQGAEWADAHQPFKYEQVPE